MRPRHLEGLGARDHSRFWSGPAPTWLEVKVTGRMGYQHDTGDHEDYRSRKVRRLNNIVFAFSPSAAPPSVFYFAA
jgi:hypothetical protein